MKSGGPNKKTKKREETLEEAIINLYLKVKIRKQEEVVFQLTPRLTILNQFLSKMKRRN